MLVVLTPPVWLCGVVWCWVGGVGWVVLGGVAMGGVVLGGVVLGGVVMGSVV